MRTRRFSVLVFCLALVVSMSVLHTGAASTVPVKWSGKISVSQYRFAPIENDVITPLIEQKLRDVYGYDVTFEPVYIETNQYLDLINLRIASDDAPDIFKVQNDTAFQQYCSQGAIAMWTEEFFRENAPDVAAFLDDGGPFGSNKAIVNAAWDMSKYEGKMAVVPLVSRNTGSLISVVYNTQWLNKLGAQVPETLDDFVALMYRFKNEDPDGNGLNDTYGFSSTMLDVIFGAYGGFPCFLDEFSFGVGDYGHWYDNGEGGLICADVLPSNKDALELIHQLYADGVLDPEFVTGENKGGSWAISHSLVNGRVGVTHSAGMANYAPAEVNGGKPGSMLAEFQTIQGADAETTIGPWITGPEGKVGGFLRYSILVAGGNVYNAKLNSDTEKLAAIFQIMDIFVNDDELSLLGRFGVEGVHYELQEGGWLKANFTSAENDAKGIGQLRGVYGPERPFNENIYALEALAPTVQWRMVNQAAYPGLAASVGYISKIYAALPSQSEYSSNLMTFRNETWLKFIQGALSLDQYDSYVQEWYARGGQVLTNEANAWLAAHE
ncbi:hypothetical protein AGMMS49992_15790 [Clostridia bacterium]|nr:hypothetical protein AGMMS49992_15790 [Clostridia bacterium]